MPAEAIHLSALDDTLRRLDAAVRREVGADDPELYQLLRLGAVMIDLAYFDRFALGVVRYLMKRPIATSPLGDQLHQHQPVRLAKALLRRARALRRERTTRHDGDRLRALALGFVSHIAVDGRLHPLVNQLAATRARRLGDRPARQHNEVEKFQSILFHEQRLGFDFMGDPRIVDYIAIHGQLLLDGGVIDRAYRESIAEVHGSAPPTAVLSRWVRGYAQYGQLLGSWFGGRIMPVSVKEQVRDEVYQPTGQHFVEHYLEAVARSAKQVEAALAFVEDLDEVRFDRAVPEGSIDDPPYATERERGLAPLG